MSNNDDDDVNFKHSEDKVNVLTGVLQSDNETLTDSKEDSKASSDKETLNASHNRAKTDDQELSQSNEGKGWEEKMERLLKQVDTFVKILKMDEDWTGGGVIYKGNVAGCLAFIYKVYFDLAKEDAPLVYINKSRSETAKRMMDSNIVAKLCSEMVNIYKHLENNVCEGKMRMIFTIVISVLWNYTDASTDFAVQVANMPGFLEFVRNVLSDLAEKHINSADKVRSLFL